MTIQSIQRAADVLNLFSYQEDRLGISEIARRLQLPKGTAQGLVQALAQSGLLVQEPAGRKYRLGLSLFHLGAVAATTHELHRQGAGAARHLADTTQLLCRLGVWAPEGPIVIFTAAPRVNAPHAHQFGPRIPAYCTAVGKALLAFLPAETRAAYLADIELTPYTAKTITDQERLSADLEAAYQRGYSITDGEIVAGRAALGAPIWGAGGALAGAAAVSGGAGRVLGPELDQRAGELLETAAEISTYLGHIPGGCHVKAAPGV